MNEHLEYLSDEGLFEPLGLDDHGNPERDPHDPVNPSQKDPIPPEVDDLARLHQVLRRRKSFTVLEFGVGYSTIVIADALQKNQIEWDELENPPDVRNRYLFEAFTVDASEKWLDYWQERLPEHLSEVVTFQYSPVEIGTFNDRLCHYYTDLPDVVPDFVYLDGPHPKQVKGNVAGLSFDCDERTVMSGDLLRMEPTMLPGTYILIDGRTNNARFLEREFQRDWDVEESPEEDVTRFELTEDRLGKYNVLGSDVL
jgi:hypothetical protein